MIFEIVNKNEVMNMLSCEDLYVLKVGKRVESATSIGKYCSSRQAVAMTLRQVMEAISNPDVAFIKITEEEES